MVGGTHAIAYTALYSRGGSKVIKIPGGIFLMASVFMKRGKHRKEMYIEEK